MEEYRAGGMVGPIDVDLGQEKIEAEWKCGGLMLDVLRQYGAVRTTLCSCASPAPTSGKTAARWMRSRSSSAAATPRSTPAPARSATTPSSASKTSASYYKLTINGRTEIEIDMVGMVFMVNGVDRQSAQRRAIGA
jgi:P2 family phage contractile tail tube protein